MTPSYNTSQVLDKVSKLLKNKKELMALLTEAHNINLDTTKAFTNAFNEKAANDLLNLRANLTNTYALRLKAVRPRLVFAQLDLLEEEIQQLAETIDFVDELMGDEIKEFASSYERFLSNATAENILQIVKQGDALDKTLSSLVNYSSILHNLLNPPSVQIDYGNISLYFSSDSSYKEVINKLSAIEELYSEICQLVGVSPSEYPLQISRVESGSLWLRLFGESKVIALLVKFIESSATFLYRKYTVEGKISAIPKQLESIETIMQVAARLEEQGVDTSKVKENIQKSMIVISQRMNDLLIGEPSVVVNGNELSVGEAYTEKFLSENRNLLLEDGSQHDDGKEGG